MDEFDELYEEWIDAINSQPLTTSRLNDFSEVLDINQRIVNHIYSIRRHLELADDVNTRRYRRYQPYNVLDRRNVNFQTNTTTNTTTTDLLNTNLITSLFSILLQGTDDLNFENMEDVKVTLTDEQFQKLNSVEVNENNRLEYETLECNICMDEYKIADNVVKLGCKHVFHKDCIKHWLCNERVTCPVCRKDTREQLT